MTLTSTITPGGGRARPQPAVHRLRGVSSRDRDWDGVRLHVVTGKGGTGKTTVAAALALALAAEGGKVLLVEVEERHGIAPLFGLDSLSYAEREIAAADNGGTVYALAVDAEAALLEYLEMFYGLRRVGGALRRFGVIDFATTIAPGARDILLTGKVTEAVRRRTPQSARHDGPGPYVYDAVVLDAPPTGRITRFLNVTAEVSGLARVGPVRDHAARVIDLIRSPETVVHFVTLLEEMPVQECVEGIAEARDAGLHVGGILVNMVRPALLEDSVLAAASQGVVDVAALTRGLQAASLPDPSRLAQELSKEIVEHARHMRVAAEARSRLAAAGRPCYDVPFLDDGVDLDGLRRLARELRDQGAV